MLKELLEAHFYCTFPKVEDKVLIVNEVTKSGNFSLVDPKACAGCKFVCNEEPSEREQLKVTSTKPVSIVNLEQAFSYIQEDVGEVCDYMLDSTDTTMLVEMTCSTTEYVKSKRPKARGQLYNALEKLFTCHPVRSHIEKRTLHYVIFSWKETFPDEAEMDDAEKSMRGMTILADAVYSPDNESKFDFGFKMKEIRYPNALVI